MNIRKGSNLESMYSLFLGGTSSAWKEVCYFFTTGIVVSAFALPIVLTRVGAVSKILVYSSHEIAEQT